MDFMPLSLNSSSLTCSICALASIILQSVATECQKLHMVDSPIEKRFLLILHYRILRFTKEHPESMKKEQKNDVHSTDADVS